MRTWHPARSCRPQDHTESKDTARGETRKGKSAISQQPEEQATASKKRKEMRSNPGKRGRKKTKARPTSHTLQKQTEQNASSRGCKITDPSASLVFRKLWVGGSGVFAFFIQFSGITCTLEWKKKWIRRNGVGLKKISRAFRPRRKGIKSAAKERTVNLLPLQSVGVLPRLLTADLWAGRGRLPLGVASRWTGAKKNATFSN